MGCHVAGLFLAALGYCDDLALVAPTRDGMQAMLQVCEKFADKVGLIFSTDPIPSKSKTKCIFMLGKRTNCAKPAPLLLNGKELPWVAQATHLGHEICETGLMDFDARVKRAKFIKDSVDIRESFSFASPVEILRATKTYCSSLYGSMLWDLDSQAAGQVFRAWNTCVKLAWGVPRATHTYFVDQLLCCGISSLKRDTLSRYSKFISSLKKSPSMEVSVIANIVMRDNRSNTWKNIKFLMEELGVDPADNILAVKQAVDKGLSQPDNIDKWRLGYLEKLLYERGEAYYAGLENKEKELTNLIKNLCIN